MVNYCNYLNNILILENSNRELFSDESKLLIKSESNFDFKVRIFNKMNFACENSCKFY